METFDASEYARWWQTAEGNLRAARHSADGGFHSTAVLLAEQAAQCALKALLHGVGARGEARGHGLLSLVDACVARAGLVVDDPDREALSRLSRDYQASRYPDALPEGTPMDHYGVGDSRSAIGTAERILRVVEAAWDGLLRADRGAPPLPPEAAPPAGLS